MSAPEAEAGDDAIGELLHFDEPFGEHRIGRAGALQTLEMDAQRRHLLPEMIVDVAGDPATLDLLHADALREQRRDLLLRAPLPVPGTIERDVRPLQIDRQ
jgi:hypothetical protein